MLYRKDSRTWQGRLRHVLVVPFIWFPLIPLIFLHITIEIYQRIAFPLCGMPIVKRRNFMVFDRAKLPYLNWYEKLYCIYCSYANGLFGFVSQIGAQTEAYWCGIKHKRREGYIEAYFHKDFVEYGDEEEFKRRYGN